MRCFTEKSSATRVSSPPRWTRRSPSLPPSDRWLSWRALSIRTPRPYSCRARCSRTLHGRWICTGSAIKFKILNDFTTINHSVIISVISDFGSYMMLNHLLSLRPQLSNRREDVDPRLCLHLLHQATQGDVHGATIWTTSEGRDKWGRYRKKFGRKSTSLNLWKPSLLVRADQSTDL